MFVRINGKQEAIEKKINLLELAASKNLSPERIVIERNQRIVPKNEWESVVLEENDEIELVSFLGGG